MRLTGRTWLMAVAAAAAGATSCGPDILNPTGSCEAPNDGGRAGYHAPGDSTWVPDCQNPLRREYWRVFATTQTSAYTMPRLDGEPRLGPACADTANALAPLVARYGLCASPMTQEQVALINNMAPVDALALTHFLHGQLVFTAGSNGMGRIDPFPMPSDIVDACALHPQSNSADLTVICNRERERLSHGWDILYTYEGPAAGELAAALNELYGITR